MVEILNFSPEDIFVQLRLFAQIPALTEKIVVREVITRAAREANLTVEAAELQQAVNNWRSMNQLDSAEETQLWLQKHYLSLEEFGDMISATVLSAKLAEHLFRDKIELHFVDYQLDRMQAAMYEIVLDDEGIAMELFYAMNEGEISFFEAAYKYIESPELACIGGYKGEVARKNLPPEIRAAVFAACPPQILKPITTSSGVHLVRVEKLIKPQLDSTVRQTIMSELFDSWLSQQIQQFKVKINF